MSATKPSEQNSPLAEMFRKEARYHSQDHNRDAP